MNPPILVLDEPASHLDPHSELAVQALIDERRGLRTTIVISHRPLHVTRFIEICEQKVLPGSLNSFNSWLILLSTPTD